MNMPGREYNVGSEYRYGFNGKENDNEINGEGNKIDFGARVYDPRIGKWLSIDPSQHKYPNLSPYILSENNPIVMKDPDGKDGIITISGNTITVHSTIYIYGSGATEAVARQMQADIMNKWDVKTPRTPPMASEGWTYTDPSTNKVYNVKFDVSVKLYEGKEKNDPFIVPEKYDPQNRDNFIKVGSTLKEVPRSFVIGGDEGEWRGVGRNGLPLKDDDPAPHEFGHLMGLGDKYFDLGNISITKTGWKGNIMAEARIGKVEQRTINALVKDAIIGLNISLQENEKLRIKGAGNLSDSTVGYNLTGVYTHEVNIDKPDK